MEKNTLLIFRPMSAQVSEIGLGVTSLQGQLQGQGLTISSPLNPVISHVTASDGPQLSLVYADCVSSCRGERMHTHPG
jgi:hypothetical protein